MAQNSPRVEVSSGLTPFRGDQIGCPDAGVPSLITTHTLSLRGPSVDRLMSSYPPPLLPLLPRPIRRWPGVSQRCFSAAILPALTLFLFLGIFIPSTLSSRHHQHQWPLVPGLPVSSGSSLNGLELCLRHLPRFIGSLEQDTRALSPPPHHRYPPRRCLSNPSPLAYSLQNTLHATSMVSLEGRDPA